MGTQGGCIIKTSPENVILKRRRSVAIPPRWRKRKIEMKKAELGSYVLLLNINKTLPLSSGIIKRRGNPIEFFPDNPPYVTQSGDTRFQRTI
ncbi:hypothetical protein TNIN_37711 [Trichonephila inaurata madagascariensis]|uniref:Uncharacterized protein n=1 Tax=Trichonephila inaurata madagascariensis TaxID=2747483 RepID=A0A8X7CBG4_9ARAC|nr:hypothetical protein TNIN_37711 [Trichonephila inaurata madagascariensis]